MPHLRAALLLPATLLAACNAATSKGTTPCPEASDSTADAAMASAKGADTGSPPAPPDAALTCAAEAVYDTGNGSPTCGEFRWDVKTGMDDDADNVSLMPVATTIAEMVTLTPPDNLDSNKQRQAPVETTTYRLSDVTMTYAKLSDDGDYHLDVSDGTNSMITEVPFPGCLTSPTPFSCFITHARASVEATFLPDTTGECVDYTVSMVGVGFFDDVAGRTGQAPNGVELHPLLGVCFGAGCDPTAQ